MSNCSDKRRFEYKDDKSSKFWEILVSGNVLNVRYGKIGTDGQNQTKEFADAATAEKQAQKLIAEKMGKGYQEVGVDKASPPYTKKTTKAEITQDTSTKSENDFYFLVTKEIQRQRNIVFNALELLNPILIDSRVKKAPKKEGQLE